MNALNDVFHSLLLPHLQFFGWGEWACVTGHAFIFSCFPPVETTVAENVVKLLHVPTRGGPVSTSFSGE